MVAYPGGRDRQLDTPPKESETHRRALAELHDEVERRTRVLMERHVARLSCHRGCSSCCQDDLSVYTVEADRIRQHHPHLIREGAPHPPGACAFLDDEGACRVYEHRPYVCRTQGLPLLWLEEDGEDVLLRRGICELNTEGTPLEQLDDDEFWQLGPAEIRLAKIQEGFGDGRLERVTLRSLFAR